MADETQNPNGPQTPQPGAPAAGPARSGSGVDPNTANAFAALDAFNRAIPAIKEIASQVDKLVERMDKVGKGAETLRKNTREFGNELKQSIIYADTMEDSVKAVFEYQKRMAREGLKADNYKDVVKVFEEMEEHNKRLVDNGVFSKKNARLLQKNTEEIRRNISALRQEMGKAFDADKVEHMVTGFMQMNKLTLDIARNMKGARMPGLRGDIDGAAKSFRLLLGMKDHGQKYRDFAKVATDIREARQSHRTGRKTAFNNQRADIEKDAVRLGFKPRMRADGSYDPARALATSHYAREAARNRGMGWAGRSIMGRAAREGAMGQGPSVLTKAGMGMLARGEGSLGRGIASYGAGALEGGAGKIAELAGLGGGWPVALALGGFSMVKAGFNKNQKMNSDVADGLGKGGIFAGGGNPITAIRNVRNNLNGPLYSPLGIGYDKNLAIAKSLQENGLSTANLANSNLGRDRQGFAGGSFGAVQRNVYAYGRLAGLDSSQTVSETIKLVSQYKQSLESTHDFFMQVTKDASTAGLTTMKYIQILDDVNSHYDRSNKLLEATVDTMRLLSVTGRNTAEDLKDAMDTVTNGGQKRDLNQSAYLNQQILSDPGLSSLNLSKLSTAKQDALTQLQSSMGPGFDASSLGPKLEKDLQGTISSLLTEAEQKFKDDPLALQSASKTIEQLRQAQVNQNNFRFAQREGANRGGLDLAVSRSLTGDDVNSQAMQTLASFKTVFKDGKFNISDLLSGNSALLSDPRYKMFSEALGTDPTKAVHNLYGMAHDAATARMDVVGRGLSEGDRNDPNSELRKLSEQTYNVLKASGMKFGPGNKYDALYNAVKDPGKRSDMIARLSKTEMSATDAFGNPIISAALRPKLSDNARNARMEDAAKLASGTRETADIWKDAFSSLFNRLQTPLDFIANILSKIGNHFGVKAETAESAGTLGGLDSRIASKKVDAALGADDAKMADLRDQIANPKAGVNVDDLKRQLEDTKRHRDHLNYVAQAAGDSTRRSQLSKQDSLDAIGEADHPDWNYKQVLGDADTGELFKNLGISGMKPGQTANFATDKFHKFEGLVDRLDPTKYRFNDTTDDKGVEHTSITYNNYNSVGITQNQDARNVVNKAPGETATPKKVTK